MNKNLPRGQIILYHSAADKTKVEVKMTGDTVWLTQDQMAVLFKKGRSTIAEHILNVFRENELEEKSVCRDFRRTGSDGKEYIVKHYNLDVIISVGYRVKSIRGTQFRIWATKTLRSHILKGYTINRTRIAQNYERLPLTSISTNQLFCNSMNYGNESNYHIPSPIRRFGAQNRQGQ